MKKTFILAAVIALAGCAAEPAQKVPVLTPGQKAAIYQALYEAETLAAARDSILKAEKTLQAALAQCGPGWSVSRDNNRDLVCVVTPKPAEPVTKK